jgi:hypothetical protein
MSEVRKSERRMEFKFNFHSGTGIQTFTFFLLETCSTVKFLEEKFEKKKLLSVVGR